MSTRIRASSLKQHRDLVRLVPTESDRPGGLMLVTNGAPPGRLAFPSTGTITIISRVPPTLPPGEKKNFPTANSVHFQPLLLQTQPWVRRKQLLRSPRLHMHRPSVRPAAAPPPPPPPLPPPPPPARLNSGLQLVQPRISSVGTRFSYPYCSFSLCSRFPRQQQQKN